MGVVGSGAGNISVGPPFLRTEGGRATLEFPIAGMEPPALIYSVPERWADFLAPRADAALAALLVPAMVAGKPLRLHGPVSERLLFHARGDMQAALRVMMPEVRQIEVTADFADCHAPVPGRNAVIAGLSNGVDSLYTAWVHLLSGQAPPGLSITHFVFSDVGSHGPSATAAARALHARRLEAVMASAAEMERPVIPLVSNIDSFYRSPFTRTHSLRNASVALALGGGVRAWLSAGSVHYEHVRPKKPISDISVSDPIMLPLLSTEAVSCVASGFGATRLDKIRAIADLQIARRHLNVCVLEAANCGACFKCARTFLCLDLLGKLESFAGVVDLTRYRAARRGYVAHVVANAPTVPILQDIVPLMREAGFGFDAGQRLTNAAAVSLRRLCDRVPAWPLYRLYRLVTGFLPTEK